MDDDPGSIGILGAGKVGTAIARQALKAGYPVSIGTGKSQQEIALIVEFMAPGARAVTAEDVMRDSDLVVIAIPLAKYRTLDADGLAGKIVVDLMNYWPTTDGGIAEFEAALASSEIVQRHLPKTRLVRTLNHIGYHELEENGLPAGEKQRQALAVAGNDAEARRLVAAFVDRLGYDPVDAGPLRAARAFQAGTPIFGAQLSRSELEQSLAAALSKHETAV